MILPDSPQDRVWVAVLLGDRDLHQMSEAEVHSTLLESDFPDRVIAAYLAARKDMKHGYA